MPSSPVRLPKGTLVEGALPLYGQIASTLWADVQADDAEPGDRLPSERVLAQRYSVSRVTVRAALNELRRRRLIDVSSSRGWYLAEQRTEQRVGQGPDSAERPGNGRPGGDSQGLADDATDATRSSSDSSRGRSHSVLGFADYAVAYGLSSRTRVLAAGAGPASLVEAETMRMAPGSPVFRIRRLRYLDDEVVALERNWVPLNFCPELVDVDFNTASLYATLRAADPPQIPRMAQYSVVARRANDDERKFLEVTDEVPMLEATQLAFNTEGRPLERSLTIYRGDRYRFQAAITN